MANTGKIIYVSLLKVSNDANEYPLDEDNKRASITGKPTVTKLNRVGDPDYVAPTTDTKKCPTA